MEGALTDKTNIVSSGTKQSGKPVKRNSRAEAAKTLRGVNESRRSTRKKKDTNTKPVWMKAIEKGRDFRFPLLDDIEGGNTEKLEAFLAIEEAKAHLSENENDLQTMISHSLGKKEVTEILKKNFPKKYDLLLNQLPNQDDLFNNLFGDGRRVSV